MSTIDWLVREVVKYHIYCNGCKKFTPHDENEYGLEICLICGRVHRTRYLKEWLQWDFANEYQFRRDKGDYKLVEAFFDVS